MTPLKLTVLGGSALATPVLFDVLGEQKAGASYQVVLHGRDSERLELIRKISQDIISGYKNLDVKLQVTTNLEEALTGADFCLNQIRVGGLDGRAFDETFPRHFGIPGEETVGPGGFSNSLRGIPVVIEICRIMEKVAPDVTVLNLTNPSSIIQYAMRRYTQVNVIGTCDSPVSLMEMIARLLGKPAAALAFALAGMHHFGWITSVKDGDEECLPEVLSRLNEMPKLGVDPELVRAINAIPGTYLRYYFHPDRVLAETEGRTIRAHQLMALSEQILAGFRNWQPGDPADILTRRGAGWYKKIVVPTLIAFAEKQTTELVLSVDNHGKLPWLPEDAIVEVPVKIEAGSIAGTRSARLPQLAQAMLSRNCAYEMLAAQAIAEKDRDKALQALMANLLVSNFNQARGILNEIWDDERKEVFKVMDLPSSQPLPHGFKVPTLYYGDKLLENYAPQEPDYALITMRELWEGVKPRLTHPPLAVAFVRELDWYQLEALEARLPQVSAIVGLGGGVAQDAAKYLGWRRHLPVDEFVSITSVDASVTKSIAARAAGHVTYIGYVVPRHVFVDYPLIQSAPSRLNRSGVGDILCAHVALWDWRYARDKTGEAYDPQAVSQTQAWLERISDEASEIQKVSQRGIQTVMQAFEDISIICRRFGSSRPQEASDHTFAYNAEFQTRKGFLHGELVALGAWVMSNLQDNNPDFLKDIYARTGICWQPRELNITREEFIRILSTLNWYQANFGRRYSILNQVQVSQDFINQMVVTLEF